MKMRDPAHPGELLAGWVADLGTTVTAFAEHIGISRVMLSRVLNGRSSVSADMDIPLSEALGTLPGYWLALQTQRGLREARRNARGRPPLGAFLPASSTIGAIRWNRAARITAALASRGSPAVVPSEPMYRPSGRPRG